MKPTPSPQPTDPQSLANAAVARSVAWRTSGSLLAALTMLNMVMVTLTRSSFDDQFLLVNGINLLLALGLWRLWSWARIVTLLRVLLGIILAVMVAQQSGGFIDLAIGVLLLASIGLPILGPPHPTKNFLGVALFVLALVGSILALLSQLVVV